MVFKGTSRRYWLGLLMVFIVFIVIAHHFVFVLPSKIKFLSRLDQQQSLIRKVLHVAEPSYAAYNYTAGIETRCTLGQVAQVKVPICTYPPAEDPIVSAFIQRGEYWEPEWVSMILEMLRQQRESIANSTKITSRSTALSFIDIGSNVGAYSLAAAHAGNQVIAIEPNWRTIRHLASSVLLGQVTDRLVLLHHAVINESGLIVHLGTDKGNRGDTWVLPYEYCKQQPNKTECQATTVSTITLEDLLALSPVRLGVADRWRVIIKIDVQGSEVKVFDPQTASRFLDEVDVVAIQMEWNQVARTYKVDSSHRAAADRMLDMFYKRNYTFHGVKQRGTEVISSMDWSRWPSDILILKGK